MPEKPRHDVPAMQDYRTRMNARIAELDHPYFKRYFGLDSQTYLAGALSPKTKELLGLVASTVLRCNDCILYHLDQSLARGATREEIYEALDVAMMVGGSVVIPHLRAAVEMLDQLEASEKVKVKSEK